MRKLFLMLAMPLALSACVIVTDDHDDWNDGHASWEQRQEANRDYIADLRPGMLMDVVRADLGRPDFSEGYTDADGRPVVILRYRTHHRHGDGETTVDETTPLVFVDGALTAWGERASREYAIAGS